MKKTSDELKNEGIEILYVGGQAFDFPLIKLWVWWVFKKIGVNLKFLLNDKVLKTYIKADIIISATGISFIDNWMVCRINSSHK